MTLANEQISRVTSKGQVLVHKSARDQIGIVPGAQVRVGSNDQGQIVIEPLHIFPTDPDQRRQRIQAAITKYAGMYPVGKSTDEQMRDLRGDREL